jgi:hypothetical protein
VPEPNPEDQRIMQLEGRNLDRHTDSGVRNHRAVLEDYKHRVISHPGKGQAIFYYNGVRVTPPVEFHRFRLALHKDEWEEKYGIGGTIWAERVRLLPFEYCSTTRAID